MNMYSWTSTTLGDYALGSIVAMGVDVADARKRVKKHYAKSSDYTKKGIALDIASDPEVLKDGVFTMFGSA